MLTFSRFLLIECDEKLLNWLDNKLRFGGGLGFLELPVVIIILIVKNKQTEILIVKCTQRKHIADAFETNPGFSTGFNLLEIKKI